MKKSTKSKMKEPILFFWAFCFLTVSCLNKNKIEEPNIILEDYVYLIQFDNTVDFYNDSITHFDNELRVIKKGNKLYSTTTFLHGYVNCDEHPLCDSISVNGNAIYCSNFKNIKWVYDGIYVPYCTFDSTSIDSNTYKITSIYLKEGMINGTFSCYYTNNNLSGTKLKGHFQITKYHY